MPYADKTKQSSYQAEWMRNRRSEWFEGKVCAHCGAKDHLELDHISCHKVKSSAARKVEV